MIFIVDIIVVRITYLSKVKMGQNIKTTESLPVYGKIMDLVYDKGQMPEQFDMPRPIESLSALVNRVEAKQSYPKEDMRNLWLKKSAERERAVKQLREIDQSLEYWISKRQFTVGVIQEYESSLQKLDMSNITTR